MGTNAISLELFIDRVEKMGFLSRFSYHTWTYKTINTKMFITCLLHGETFQQVPKSHLNGRNGCSQCKTYKYRSSKNIQYTPDLFFEKAKQIHGDLYDYDLKTFTQFSKKMNIFCKRCNSWFEQTPSNHITCQQGCNKCNQESVHLQLTKSTEEFIKQVLEIHGNFYSYELVKYVKDCIKVCITCPIHGQFSQIPSDHIQGKGCPRCNTGKISKPNIMIAEWFENKGYTVNLEEHHGCKNPKTGRCLNFDVTVLELDLLCEFNGKQHYEGDSFFNNKAAESKDITPQQQLEYVQFKDEVKRQWALKNNYQYLCIPYWERKNIPQILEKWMESYGKSQTKTV